MTGTTATNNSNTEDGEELINFADSNSIEYYARIPNEVLGMISKKVITPNGNVEKIDGDDLVWWGFFYTFLYQKKACYMTRETIAERLDCDPKTVTRRTTKLERLGLLTVNKRSGTSNIYTAATVEQFLAMKTSEKVTPKTEKAEQNGKSESKEQQPAAVEPSTVGNGEHNCLQQLVDHRVDAVSPHDEVSEEDDPPFPEEKQEPKQNPAVQTERNIAHPNKLSNWINGGDDEGFMAYGKLWGETKPRKIADLIRNHYQITQKDEAQGFKSVANNEHSGADIHYRQQQAQKAAAMGPTWKVSANCWIFPCLHWSNT